MVETKEKEVVYELAFLLKAAEQEADLLKALAEFNAEIVSKTPVHQIQLAYVIKKLPSAFFGWYHFKVKNAEDVKKISESLKLKDFVVRFLLVKVPKQTKRIRERAASKEAAAEKKAAPVAAAGVTRLDNLSNEKLEETLEEILK